MQPIKSGASPVRPPVAYFYCQEHHHKISYSCPRVRSDGSTDYHVLPVNAWAHVYQGLLITGRYVQFQCAYPTVRWYEHPRDLWWADEKCQHCLS